MKRLSRMNIQFLTQYFIPNEFYFYYTGRIEEINIDRKISFKELNSLIKNESSSRALKRLYFIKFRYLGDFVQEAANKIGVTKKTGYDWQKEWNKGGYATLIPDLKVEESINLQINREKSCCIIPQL